MIDNKELFIRWYAWSVSHKDCDPSVWLTNYLNHRYEHNSEERVWLCWLYGNTYYLPTSWVLKNEFPDYELATLDRITCWNNDNYKRLRYQTDFDNLWKVINTNYHKFGRYTTWFYMQHLKHTAGIKIEPTSLMLNDYSGSKSHRNGLLYALNKEEWINAKLTAKEYQWLEDESQSILVELRDRYPTLAAEFDAFTMETCLCSFKKIFREKSSRYLGFYLDRQADEINKVAADSWYGIEWNVLWQAREETLDSRLLSRYGVNKDKCGEYVRSGRLDRMHWMFDVEQKSVGLEDLFS